jgi:hypothetical protein
VPGVDFFAIPWSRHSLDKALVTAASVRVPTESTGCHHHARRNREEATGTWSTRQIDANPSFISIHGASITVTALN